MGASSFLSNDLLIAVLMSVAIAVLAFPVVIIIMVLVIRAIKKTASKK